MYIKRQKQNKQTKNKQKQKQKTNRCHKKIAPSFTVCILFLNIGNLESRTNRTKNRR